MAIGTSAAASGSSGAVALGRSAVASGTTAIAIGDGSLTNVPSGTAVGNNTTVGHSGGIALGHNAATSAVNQFALPSSYDRTGAFTIGDGSGTGTLSTPGTPQAYMTLNVGGTLYGIPLYTIVTPT